MYTVGTNEICVVRSSLSSLSITITNCHLGLFINLTWITCTLINQSCNNSVFCKERIQRTTTDLLTSEEQESIVNASLLFSMMGYEFIVLAGLVMILGMTPEHIWKFLTKHDAYMSVQLSFTPCDECSRSKSTGRIVTSCSQTETTLIDLKKRSYFRH